MSTWRVSRRMAVILAAVMLTAVPAVAAIFIQNFVRVDLEVAACFTKTAGADVDGVVVSFTDTPTITANGVDLTQEQVFLQTHIGERSIYTSVINYNNDCGADFDLELRAEADAAGGPAVTDGTMEHYVEVYLSNTDDPGTNPLTDPADWTLAFTIDALGTVTNTGATVAIADTESLTSAFVIDTDAGAVEDDDGDAAVPESEMTIRYTAELSG